MSESYIYMFLFGDHLQTSTHYSVSFYEENHWSWFLSILGSCHLGISRSLRRTRPSEPSGSFGVQTDVATGLMRLGFPFLRYYALVALQSPEPSVRVAGLAMLREVGRPRILGSAAGVRSCKMLFQTSSRGRCCGETCHA